MKLNKKITVDGKEVPLVSDNTVLELNQPGRAILVMQSETPLAGTVQIFFGWNDELHLWFTGVIESSVTMDRKQQRLIVKELPELLKYRAPVSLRRTTPKAVLQAMAEINGLEIIPEKSWLEYDLPVFINPGSGLHLLHGIRRACAIDQFMIQSQPNGSVYVGTWKESPIAKADLSLSPDLLQEVTALSGSMPIMHFLRPGVRLAIGQGKKMYVTKITASGEMMKLNWSENPWKN